MSQQPLPFPNRPAPANQAPQYAPNGQLQQGPPAGPVLVTPYNHSLLVPAPAPPTLHQTVPINGAFLSDPDLIKEQEMPCVAQCPHCKYTGVTVVGFGMNFCITIIALILCFVFIGVFIIPLARERTHNCSRCMGEIARKKKCC